MLRQQHFPPELNRIPAHLTLFHSLPESDEVQAALGSIAGQTEPFAMQVTELKSLGRGVALFLTSPQARTLHRKLTELFTAALSAQDRQGFRPHVVVQNKVAPQLARETFALLQAGFQPWQCQAVGLDLWRYLGGPWLHLRRFDFAAR